jgi:hypothetical protein
MIRDGDLRIRSVAHGFTASLGYDGRIVKSWGATRLEAEENVFAAVEEADR